MTLPFRFSVCLSVLTALVIAPAVAAPRIVEMTPDQLTDQAKHQFPQRRCAGGYACVTLTEPTIRIFAGEPRLMLRANATPALGGQPLDAGLIEVAAKPEYRAAEGAFFLKDPILTRFEFPGLPVGAAATIAGVLRPIIADAMSTTPVWALDESDPQQAMLRIVLQKVEVIDGKLRVTIGQ